MFRIALRRILGRKLASAAVVAGLLAAAIAPGLSLIVAAQARVALVGDIEQAWRTPYDLLIRGTGSTASLEDTDGLIRPNFVTGLHGGITREQLAEVRRDPDVAVAAPVAVVGFVNWPLAVYIPLDTTTARDAVRAYRITTRIVGDAGLSDYAVERRTILTADQGTYRFSQRELQIGDATAACSADVECFAGTVCRGSECERAGFPSAESTRYYLPLLVPIPIAGIDPLAEATLLHLDRCVASGRYLKASDRLREVGDPEEAIESIPVLLAARSFVDQRVEVHIETSEADVRGKLVIDPTSFRWLPARDQSFSIDQLYRDYIPSVRDYLDPWPLWTTSDVDYRLTGPRSVEAEPLVGNENPFATAPLSTEYGIDPRLLIPPEAGDVPFRSVSVHPDAYRPGPDSAFRWKSWNVVGQYDPECLPGFDPLAGGALETYSYPEATTKDGRTLTPTRSLTGYISSPPLLLTSLDAAEWLADPRRYRAQPGKKFISAIRVSVTGSVAPSEESYERLTVIATRLAKATGLQVDVVKGSSATPVSVALPGGRFGRPALDLTEGWSLKGAVVRARAAVTLQDLALSILTAAFGASLAIAAALSTAASNRLDHEILDLLGWPASTIRRLLLLEHAVLGAIAAVIALIALGITRSIVGSGDLVLIFLAGGCGPVLLSVGLGAWLLIHRPARLLHVARNRPATHLREFVVLTLRRDWFTSLATVACLALAGTAAGLTAVVALSFGGRVELTALGVELAVVSGNYQWFLSAVSGTCAILCVAQMQWIAYTHDREALATLMGLGWTSGWLRSYIGAQAWVTGALGGCAAAIVIAAAGVTLGASPGTVAAVGITTAVLAAIAARVGAFPVVRAATKGASLSALREES